MSCRWDEISVHSFKVLYCIFNPDNNGEAGGIVAFHQNFTLILWQVYNCSTSLWLLVNKKKYRQNWFLCSRLVEAFILFFIQISPDEFCPRPPPHHEFCTLALTLIPLQCQVVFRKHNPQKYASFLWFVNKFNGY